MAVDEVVEPDEKAERNQAGDGNPGQVDVVEGVVVIHAKVRDSQLRVEQLLLRARHGQVIVVVAVVVGAAVGNTVPCGRSRGGIEGVENVWKRKKKTCFCRCIF